MGRCIGASEDSPQRAQRSTEENYRVRPAVSFRRNSFLISLDISLAVGIMRQSSLQVFRIEELSEVFMSVLELCDREIAAVGLDATVADAINKMLDHHVGAVAVVDNEYRVAGIFTERDVLR